MIYIYLLIDPRTHKPRYVGQSADPSARYYGHMSKAGVNEANDRWIAKLESIGLAPVLEVIETIDIDRAHERERHWINRYHIYGCNLNNAEVLYYKRKVNKRLLTII